MSQTQNCAQPAKCWIKTSALKALRWVVAGLLFGWFYGWASPTLYSKTSDMGFGHGMLHGAIMPMAMPSLVMGKDVTIYAPNNKGRFYKLGYTVGINICGFIFFGMIFARPKRNNTVTASSRFQ